MYGVFPLLSGFEGGIVGYEQSDSSSRAIVVVDFIGFAAVLSGQALAKGFFLGPSLTAVEH